MTLSKKGSAAVRADKLPQRAGSEAPAESQVLAAHRPKPSPVMFDQHKAMVRWASVLRSWRAYALWCELWNRSPRDGRTFHITVRTLATQVGIDERSAKRCLKQLLEHGLLKQVSKGSGFARKANEYRLPTVLPAPPT